MPAANVTVNAAFRSTAPSEWSQLVSAFSEGGVVTLTQDVAAQEGDGRLAVPSGKTVTLDLNGHTLGPSNNKPFLDRGKQRNHVRDFHELLQPGQSEGMHSRTKTTARSSLRRILCGTGSMAGR